MPERTDTAYWARMGYVNTIAFNSLSTARHGGDPGWVRRGNWGHRMRLPLPMKQFSGDSSDLSGAEAIGTAAQIATTIASLGKTFADLRQSKIDAKDQKNAAKKAQEAADALVRAAADDNKTLTAKLATQSGGTLTPAHLAIGVAVLGAVALGAVVLLRRA